MHPFFTKPERLLFYIGSWLGLSLLASFAVSYPDRSFLSTAVLIVPISLSFSLVSLSSWYLCRSIPLRETHPIRIGVLVIAGSIVGGWLFQGISIGWVWVLSDAIPETSGIVPGGPLVVFTTGFVLYLLSIIFHYLLLAFELSLEAERRSLEAEIHARSSELKALRAQIDPHFLFNALNSIASLISADPARARTMTVQLADFFRASVSAGRRQVISLSEELDLVSTYLEIESVRYGDRLHTEITRTPETDTLMVPPLILQPLVENAVKHGIAQMIEGGTIRVDSKKNGNILAIEVENAVDQAQGGTRNPGTGFGIRAVRDRLKVIAPGHGYLDIRSENELFIATISLPTDLHE